MTPPPMTDKQLARATELAETCWPEIQGWMLALIAEVRRLREDASPFRAVDRQNNRYCREHDSTHCNCPDTGPLAPS